MHLRHQTLGIEAADGDKRFGRALLATAERPQALGAEAQVDVDTLTLPLVAGDRLVLCSDGLTTALHDADIARLAGAAPTPDALCRALVTQTLMAGAPDNVSVVCIFALGPRR